VAAVGRVETAPVNYHRFFMFRHRGIYI
jgi:hypothetical protein